jgi:hypothetical protein
MYSQRLANSYEEYINVFSKIGEILVRIYKCKLIIMPTNEMSREEYNLFILRIY